MERSENFNFYLPSRDGDDIADINQISYNFSLIDQEVYKKEEVDQVYDANSANPQSGIALAWPLQDLENRKSNNDHTHQATEILVESYTPTYLGDSVQAALDQLNNTVTAQEETIALPATNSISNGDFSNGTTGYTGSFGTISAANNTMSIVGDGGGLGASVRQVTTTPCVIGHKIYVRALVSVNNITDIDYLCVRVDGSTAGVGTNIKSTEPITADTFIAISGVQKLDNTFAGFLRPQFGAYRKNGALDNTYTCHGKYMTAIDLTSVFGADNEPTATQMDTLLSYFPNSWFDGTANLFNAKMAMKSFYSLDNTKADKLQEAWITPTLINGWTASTYPVSYFKDSLGFVHLKGFATGGTLDSIIFTLPTAYIPKQVLFLVAYASYADDAMCAKIGIGLSGNVLISRTNVNVSLDNISFYVGV